MFSSHENEKRMIYGRMPWHPQLTSIWLLRFKQWKFIRILRKLRVVGTPISKTMLQASFPTPNSYSLARCVASHYLLLPSLDCRLVGQLKEVRGRQLRMPIHSLLIQSVVSKLMVALLASSGTTASMKDIFV